MITSVGQRYKSMESQHDYKTGTRTMFGRWETPIDIGKSGDNFKDGKPKCFNLSGAVHTGVEVHRMDSEMSRLVEQPWL